MNVKVVCLAREWLGTPYLHQSSTKGAGTDCLGLIRGIWREIIGDEPVVIPPYTMDWCEPNQDETLLKGANDWLIQKDCDDDLALGNILLFRMRSNAIAKHLGIVSELAPTRKFIHAYSGHGVVENTLSTPWLKRIVACYEFPLGDN